jgi:hypothetical protein
MYDYWFQTEAEIAAELVSEYRKEDIFRDQRRQYSVGEKVVVRNGTQLWDHIEPPRKELQRLIDEGTIGTIVTSRLTFSVREYLADFGNREEWMCGDEMKLAVSYDDLVGENRRLRSLLITLLKQKNTPLPATPSASEATP